MTTTIPPKHLSPEAQALWEQYRSVYVLDDCHAELLLTTALEAYDRMRQAQAELKNGCVLYDRFEQAKAHPAATVERDARTAMMHALKALNLDLEPLRDAR